MEKYNVDDNLKDPFLEKMFLKLPVVKTSNDFTKQVMGQLYASVEPQIEPETYRKQMLWAYFSIAVGISVIALMLFAVWPFFELNMRIDSAQVLNFINTSLNLFNGLTNFVDYLQESSLIITIAFAIFLLLIVERLFNKRVPNGNTSAL